MTFRGQKFSGGGDFSRLLTSSATKWRREPGSKESGSRGVAEEERTKLDLNSTSGPSRASVKKSRCLVPFCDLCAFWRLKIRVIPLLFCSNGLASLRFLNNIFTAYESQNRFSGLAGITGLFDRGGADALTVAVTFTNAGSAIRSQPAGRGQSGAGRGGEQFLCFGGYFPRGAQ